MGISSAGTPAAKAAENQAAAVHPPIGRGVIGAPLAGTGPPKGQMAGVCLAGLMSSNVEPSFSVFLRLHQFSLAS